MVPFFRWLVGWIQIPAMSFFSCAATAFRWFFVAVNWQAYLTSKSQLFSGSLFTTPSGTLSFFSDRLFMTFAECFYVEKVLLWVTLGLQHTSTFFGWSLPNHTQIARPMGGRNGDCSEYLTSMDGESIQLRILHRQNWLGWSDPSDLSDPIQG